jgi:site-specific recombinase XerD
VLGAVDRRTACGKRDYTIVLLVVVYGLRGREVVALTLDDINWKRECLAIPERKVGHSTAIPLSTAVGGALLDYLQHGRPQTTDRRVFFRSMAPVRPVGAAAVSACATRYLLKAEGEVPRPGSQTLRHTVVRRLFDADSSLKTIGDFMGYPTGSRRPADARSRSSPDRGRPDSARSAAQAMLGDAPHETRIAQPIAERDDFVEERREPEVRIVGEAGGEIGDEGLERIRARPAPDARGPAAADVRADRLAIAPEVAGDGRDRPTSPGECVDFHVFSLCEHGPGPLPSCGVEHHQHRTGPAPFPIIPSRTARSGRSDLGRFGDQLWGDSAVPRQRDEIEKLLRRVPRESRLALLDGALLLFLDNAGARVQEAADLRIEHLDLAIPMKTSSPFAGEISRRIVGWDAVDPEAKRGAWG